MANEISSNKLLTRNNDTRFDSFRRMYGTCSFRAKASNCSPLKPIASFKSVATNRKDTLAVVNDRNIDKHSYSSATKSFSSKIADKTLSTPKSIVSHTNNYSSYNNNVDGGNINGKTKLQLPTSSGTSSAEMNDSKFNGLLNDTTKRIYSSMRITKKEMPYLRTTTTTTTNNKMMADKSVISGYYANENKNNKFTAINKKPALCHDNNAFARQKSNTNNRSLITSRNTQFVSNIPKYGSYRIGNNNNNKNVNNNYKQSFSTEFPNGLPFEDEFYHKKREKSYSSKSSELSDYGSIENDSDQSQSRLPFEEEFACQRPSTEALYVDFSKPIFKKTTTNSYSKSSLNDFSSSSCSSSNSSSNVAINKVHKYDYSYKNCVNNSNEVIVNDQPVVHVAVQWYSKQNGPHNRRPHRFDAV